MPGNDDGHVREEIGAQREAINNLIRTWAEQDRKATDLLRELYRKFDELKDKVHETSAKVDNLAQDFSEMKPVVRTFEIRAHRSAGARWALGTIWGVLAGGVAAIAWVIHEWAGLIIGLLWPPKH
jgi:hypothetical protein